MSTGSKKGSKKGSKRAAMPGDVQRLKLLVLQQRAVMSAWLRDLTVLAGPGGQRAWGMLLSLNPTSATLVRKSAVLLMGSRAWRSSAGRGLAAVMVCGLVAQRPGKCSRQARMASMAGSRFCR